MDNFHTNEKLTGFAKKFFEDKGYTVKIGKPYNGSIVPIEHYKKNKHVRSLMIEINRKLYLKGGTNIKSETFDQTQKTVHEFLTEIGKVCL